MQSRLMSWYLSRKWVKVKVVLALHLVASPYISSKMFEKKVPPTEPWRKNLILALVYWSLIGFHVCLTRFWRLWPSCCKNISYFDRKWQFFADPQNIILSMFNIREILKACKMRNNWYTVIRFKEDFIPTWNMDQNDLLSTKFAICINMRQIKFIWVILDKCSYSISNYLQNWSEIFFELWFQTDGKDCGDHHIWSKWIGTNLTERYFNKLLLF